MILESAELGSMLDFYKRNINNPIEIQVIFSLNISERDEFIRDIVSEVPEMRHAVEGLDPALLLSVTVRVRAQTTAHDPLLYVSKIALVTHRSLSTGDDGRSRVILEITDDAATELRGHRQASQRFRGKAITLQRFIERFDADDWTRLSGREGGGGAPIRYFLRELAGSPAEARELQQLVEGASSYQELRERVLSQVNELQAEAAQAESSALQHTLSTITGDVTKVPTYITTLLSRIAEMKVLHLRERRREIGAEEAERLLALKMSRGGPEILRSIQATVQSLLAVQVDAFAGEVSDRQRGYRAGSDPQSRRAELDVDDFLVEANGSGIREALRIILDCEFGHPDVVLIEEPEIHLHPGLETSMLRYLRELSGSCQVFIATHSTNFLDTADIGNVYLIYKDDGATNVRLLTLQEAGDELPGELGLRLSSLFMFDRLVFVEGMTDEIILREAAARMSANLASVNAGFVVMGGARGFRHFAAESTIAFLSRRQIKCWFVLDRDEKGDEEVEKLEKILGEKAKLFVLKKREMENYLVAPRALATYIEERMRETKPSEDPEEIKQENLMQQLSACADELREFAIYKQLVNVLCKPNFSDLTSRHELRKGEGVEEIAADIDARIGRLSEARERLAEFSDEVRARVEGAWEDQKLDIVPGDELLNALFQKYGLRYRKDRDGRGLAAALRLEEVHADLKTIVRDIVRDE